MDRKATKLLMRLMMLWAVCLGSGVGSGALAAVDRCVAIAGAPWMRMVQPAQLAGSGLKFGEARITFTGHATFLIESAKGVRIATDYNDIVRPPEPLDIVTMNRAHTTHFTHFPEPTIGNVLRGWNPAGGPAQHDVTVRDVRVRNVPTNIRSFDGGTDEFGNSIFVFEMSGLCIAHLGHLHHTLSARQIAQIGQMDVVLAAVDGSFTLDTPGMMEVLKAIKAPLVIPMHYFSSFTLNRFLDVAKTHFEIVTSPGPTVVVSRATLPPKPRVLVLPGH